MHVEYRQYSMNTQHSSSSKNRLREFDALRGFSIFLVVYTHILMVAGLGGHETFLGDVITSFYMALFFFISGFFAWKPASSICKQNITHVLPQKFKALVVSSVVFFALLNYSRSSDIFGWMTTGFRSYWFTIVLFQMFVIFYTAIGISKLVHREIALPIMITLSLVALVVLRSHLLYNWRLWQILDMANLCLFLQFFTFGMICRKYSAKFQRIISNNITITILIITFVLIFCILRIPAVFENEIITLLIYTFITTYIGILLLVSLFYISRYYFEKSGFIQNSLCRWGQRSLDIYMLHFFFLPNLLLLKSFLSPDNMIVFQIAICGGLSVFVIAISLLTSCCIRTSDFLASWLFGSGSRKYSIDNAKD